MSKNEYLQVRISEEEKAELNEVAAALPDTSSSQIVREAIREKVAKLKRKIATKEHPEPVTAGL